MRAFSVPLGRVGSVPERTGSAILEPTERSRAIALRRDGLSDRPSARLEERVVP
jgi:hypothetical protein